MTDTQKPRLSRDILKSYGIEYRDELYNDEQSEHVNALPDRVINLRRALLYFGSPGLSRWKKDFEQNYEDFMREVPPDKKTSYAAFNVQPPESVYRSPARSSSRTPERMMSQSGREFNRIAHVAEIAQDGLEKEAEAGCTNFLRNHIFKGFRSSIPATTDYDKLFDRWCLEENVQWNNLKLRRDYDATRPKLSGPKPDLTYAFPVLQSMDELPAGFADHDSAVNFSSAVLRKVEKALTTTPTTGLRRSRADDLLTKPDLMCFPWAIVEVKRGKSQQPDIEFCYCQAANDAAVALEVLENLKASVDESKSFDLPPLIAFTCVGSELRVWLAYHVHESGRGNRVNMICIWVTNLQLYWGVYSTLLIIKNMHIWASRIYKPQISHRLSLLRRKLVANGGSINALAGSRAYASSSFTVSPVGSPRSNLASEADSSAGFRLARLSTALQDLSLNDRHVEHPMTSGDIFLGQSPDATLYPSPKGSRYSRSAQNQAERGSSHNINHSKQTHLPEPNGPVSRSSEEDSSYEASDENTAMEESSCILQTSDSEEDEYSPSPASDSEPEAYEYQSTTESSSGDPGSPDYSSDLEASLTDSIIADLKMDAVAGLPGSVTVRLPSFSAFLHRLDEDQRFEILRFSLVTYDAMDIGYLTSFLGCCKDPRASLVLAMLSTELHPQRITDFRQTVRILSSLGRMRGTHSSASMRYMLESLVRCLPGQLLYDLLSQLCFPIEDDEWLAIEDECFEAINEETPAEWR